MSIRAVAVRLEDKHTLCKPDGTRAIQLLSIYSDLDCLRLAAHWIVLRMFPPR